GPVKPVLAAEDLLPINHAGLQLGDRTMGAVVDDLRGPLRCAGFQVEGPESLAAPQDKVRIHSKLSKVVDARLPDLGVGHDGDDVGLHSVVGERHRRVGFRSRVAYHELTGLYQALEALGGQTHQQLAEKDRLFAFWHGPLTY